MVPSKETTNGERATKVSFDIHTSQCIQGRRQGSKSMGANLYDPTIITKHDPKIPKIDGCN